MFDLLERAKNEWASVPVPLPGRVMLFAGPGGVPMVRKSDGKINPLSKADRLIAPVLAQTQALQTLFSVDIENLAAGDVIEAVAPIELMSTVTTLITLEVWVDGVNSSGMTYFNGTQIHSGTDVKVVLLARHGTFRVTAAVTGSTGNPVHAIGAIVAGKLATVKIKLVQASGAAIPTAFAWPVRVKVL